MKASRYRSIIRLVITLSGTRSVLRRPDVPTCWTWSKCCGHWLIGYLHVLSYIVHTEMSTLLNRSTYINRHVSIGMFIHLDPEMSQCPFLSNTLKRTTSFTREVAYIYMYLGLRQPWLQSLTASIYSSRLVIVATHRADYR